MWINNYINTEKQLCADAEAIFCYFSLMRTTLDSVLRQLASKKENRTKLPKFQIAVTMVTLTTMWFDLAFQLLPSKCTSCVPSYYYDVSRPAC